MTTKTLVIERLSRMTSEGEEEVLHLREGVTLSLEYRIQEKPSGCKCSTT